jgi:hypothetical protein
MAVDQFPDAEALVAHAIRTGVAGSRVYSSVPNDPTYPLVTVRRIGGTPMERHRWDEARIQIDVWGTSKSEAFDLAQAARQAAHAMEGVTYSTGAGAPAAAFVSAVDDDLGLTFLPDTPTGRDRYIIGVAVVIRNAA